MKRTPLEQAIAEKDDRRERYKAKLRDQGAERFMVYVPREFGPKLQAIGRAMIKADDVALAYLETELAGLHRYADKLLSDAAKAAKKVPK